MAVNGTGSLVILVIVLLTVLTYFQAHVHGKTQFNFNGDKESNVSRIIDETKTNDQPTEAMKGQFPWQVYMKVKFINGNDDICGGSIIDPKWIMSAAHCVAKPEVQLNGAPSGYRITALSVVIYAGLTEQSGTNGNHVQHRDYADKEILAKGKEKRVFIHKDFNREVFAEYDIVLFKLEDPFKLNFYVQPIHLATSQDTDYVIAKQIQLTVSGWGHISFSDTPTDTLRWLNCLELQTRSDCLNRWKSKSIICHNTVKKNVYRGDSGGPLVYKIEGMVSIYVQIGIVSGGSTVINTYEGHFTDVGKLRPWIHEAMGYIESPTGYFRSSGRWYRLFRDKQVTWTEARARCHSSGMRLAEPNSVEAVIGLRRDAHLNFGDNSIAWLGAKREQDQFVYVNSGVPITVDQKDLFRPWPQAPINDLDLCLLLDITDDGIGSHTDKPLSFNICTRKLYYPLCGGDNSMAWLGAKHEQGQFVYVNSKSVITDKNAELFPPHGPITTLNLCLLLDTIDGGIVNHKEKPLSFDICTRNLYYTLCEDAPDSSYTVCQGGSSAVITRSGSVRCVLPTNVTTTTVPTTTSCPDVEGIFKLTVGGPGQCFKAIEEKATWEKADDDCKKLNLTLAQPFAPVQLRSYLVQEYGPDFDVWLGACQDEPNNMTWKRGGEEITRQNQFWYPGQPKADEGCLLLLSTEKYLKKKPMQPFRNVKSTKKFYPLCEWLPTEVMSTTEVKPTTEIVPTTVVVPTRSCPDDEDFFTQDETNKCFKIIPQKATWEKADEECKKLNLTLAQPDAPVQLRSYLVKTYEPEPFVWLGACQDEPNKITWKRGGEEIPFADPLWYPGQPDHDEGCLLLLARDDYLEEEPEKPFWNVLPTHEFYPLCEMVLE